MNSLGLDVVEIILSINLVHLLREKGLFKLCQVLDTIHTIVWKQEWKSAKMLYLLGEEVEEREEYISSLVTSHVRIKYEVNVFKW